MLVKTKLALGFSCLLLLLLVNSWQNWTARNELINQAALVTHLQDAADSAREGDIALLRFLLDPSHACLSGMRDTLRRGTEQMREALPHIRLAYQQQRAHDLIATFGDFQAVFWEFDRQRVRQEAEYARLLASQNTAQEALATILNLNADLLRQEFTMRRFDVHRRVEQAREEMLLTRVAVRAYVAITTAQSLDEVREGLAACLEQLKESERFFTRTELLDALLSARSKVLAYQAAVQEYTQTQAKTQALHRDSRVLMNQVIEATGTMTATAVEHLENVHEEANMVSTLTTALALLSGFTIAVLLMRAVTRHVNSALSFAHSVGGGDFNARWNIRSNDEVGCIAASLNRAFAQVADRVFWYENLLDSIPCPVSVTDNHMRWTFCNKAAQDMLGKTRDELLGVECWHWNAHICRTEQCGVTCLHRAAARLGNGHGGHDGALTAHTSFSNGEKLYAVDCSFVVNKEGQRTGYVEFVRDVTETEGLRLRAEAASRAKSEFLSTVSHEIRTPMNAIVGFVHLFDRSNLTETQKDKLDKIKLSADALLSVINDVLDISKIEAGKLELDHAPFCLSRVLSTVRSIVEYAALRKDIFLSVSVGDEVPDMLVGDHKRLSQILLNLMNNAVKFTSRGGVRVIVNVDPSVPVDPETVMLFFSVADTGMGISGEQMERLFQPFMQADSSVTRRFGGTGLGLAISRQLVELMGGAIGVESRLGKGSTFRFVLPLGRGGGVESLQERGQGLPQPDGSVGAGKDTPDARCGMAAGSAEKPPDRAETLTRLAGARVLVVEDNEINQEIAKALLEEWGVTVDVAENGREALGMLSHPYQCIFMDMQMPVMGGVEATRRLRALGKQGGRRWLAEVPIVAMTANALAEDRRRCLEAGMNGHIGKPIDPEVLRLCLLQWIDRR